MPKGVDYVQGHFDIHSAKFGVPHQYKKVDTGTSSETRVPRSGDRFVSDDSVTSTGKSFKNKRTMFRDFEQGNSTDKGIVSADRKAVLVSNSSVACPSPVQRHATSTNCQFKVDRFLWQLCESNSRDKVGAQLVGKEFGFVQWEDVDCKSTSDCDPIRCINERVGCSMSQPLYRRSLVKNGTTGAHQPARTQSSKVGNLDICRDVQTKVNPYSNGQYYSFILFDKNGRNCEHELVKPKQRDFGILDRSWDHDNGGTFTQSLERFSGQGISVDRSQRMEIELTSFPKNMQTSGLPDYRPVCITGVQSSPSVLLTKDRSLQQRDRCFLSFLDISNGIRIPSFLSHRTCSEESPSQQSNLNINNTSLADTILVSSTTPNVNKKPSSIATHSRSSKRPVGERSSSCHQSHTQIGGVDSIRQNLIEEGLSEETASIIIQARRGSTRSHYESAWKQWNSWCSRRQISPTRCSVKLNCTRRRKSLTLLLDTDLRYLHFMIYMKEVQYKNIQECLHS